MKFSIKDIARIAIFTTVIVVASFIESFLPSLKDGGAIIKLSEVTITALIILNINKVNNKAYITKIISLSIISSLAICYFSGMFKYATLPAIFLFDYTIPYLSPLIIILAKPKSLYGKILLTFIAAIIAFISHIFSGFIVYQVTLIGSLIYNLWYCITTYIAQLFIVIALHKRKIS